MEFFLALLFTVAVISVTIRIVSRSPPSHRYPPGPFSFPIIGSLLSLQHPLHRHFANLSSKYGPIIYLKIGMVPFLVVNSKEAAQQVLKVHDLQFANRPVAKFFELVSLGWNDIIVSQPNQNWKKLRKISTMNLFTANMLRVSAGFRESEMKVAFKSIRDYSGSQFDLGDVMNKLVSNSVSLLLFGQRELELITSVKGVASSALNLNIGDLIPALDWLDLHGIYRRMRTKVMPHLKQLVADHVEQHRRDKQQAGESFVPRDFVDVLISLEDEDKLSDISMLALLIDMILGGLETTLTTLEWTMAELMAHPQIISKVQEEIDRVVGRARSVQESDVPNLPLIEAVLKESLRLHPPLPLGVPHTNLNPVNLDGYTVPVGCKVLVNIWAIGRDPKNWPDPNKFQPDRFLRSNISITGQQFEAIPFSSGRRSCVGYPLAIRSISFFLASLLHAFNWSLVDNIDLADERTKSMSMKINSRLIVNAAPRRSEGIY